MYLQKILMIWKNKDEIMLNTLYAKSLNIKK
jgi:hypothetical protein